MEHDYCLNLLKQKAAEKLIFGSQAVWKADPIALRPCLTAGLPFRKYIKNFFLDRYASSVKDPTIIGDCESNK